MKKKTFSSLTSERLDKHVNTFVSIFITTGGEHVQGIVEVEIVVSIEMSADELVNFCLGSSVQVLELVHRLEFDNVKPIWKDTIRFAFEKMFAFVGCDVGDGCEDVCTMGCGALNAVPVVNTTFSSFVVNIKVLEVIVEID